MNLQISLTLLFERFSKLSQKLLKNRKNSNVFVFYRDICLLLSDTIP